MEHDYAMDSIRQQLQPEVKPQTMSDVAGEIATRHNGVDNLDIQQRLSDSPRVKNDINKELFAKKGATYIDTTEAPFTDMSNTPAFGFSTKPVKGSKQVHAIEKAFQDGKINADEAQGLLEDLQSTKPVVGAIEKYKKEKIGSAPEDGKSLKQTAKDFYTDWVNRFQPVEDVVAGIEKRGKLQVRPEYNPKYQIQKFLGSGGIAEQRHYRELNPILEELGDIPKSDFDVFLRAQRDIELAGRGIKGSDAQQAEEVIGELGQKYDLEKLNGVAEKLYTYQSKNLENLKDSGFLSGQSVEEISAKNQRYVPFQRVMEDVDNFLGVPSSKVQNPTNPVKGIKGSDRAIYSPLESIIADTYKVQAAVSKNNVARSIANLSNIADDAGIKQVSKSDSNTISVWMDGKKQFYEVPEDVSRSVKGLNEENLGVLERVLSAPARLLRQQATGRNIDFFVPNIVRDQMDAAVNSKYGYRPFLDYLDGFIHLAKYKYGGGDQLVEDWIDNGGGMFFENMGGRKEISKQIADATENKGFVRRSINQLTEWALGGIDTVGAFSEKPTRIGLYKRALEATNNPTIAMSESREGTLDFARMGAKMKVANSLVPFLNVSVQGFDKMVRSSKDHPARFAVALAATSALPQAMTSLYNNLYHPEQYNRIPDFEKQGNFIVVTGVNKEGDPTYLKIPKGHIAQLAANPVDNLITYMANNKPQTFQQMAWQMLSVIPLVGEGNSAKEVAARTIGGIIPQAFKPAVQQVANYNFFTGKPIVPFYSQNKPAAEQYNKSTPEAYKKIGRLTNTSPLRLKDFTETTLAAGVKNPLNIFDTLSSISKGEAPDINKIPILRRFSGSYADFDNERPDQVGQQQTSSASVLPQVNASEQSSLPVSDVRTKELYDNSVKEIKNYAEKSNKIKYGVYVSEFNRQEAQRKLDEKFQNAVKIRTEIAQRRPEIVDEMRKTPLQKSLQLTGNSALDARLVSDYKSDLTKYANDIYKNFVSGKITQEQAAKELDAVQNKINSLKKQKTRKVKIPKVKRPAKLRIKKIKLKVASVKMPKLKKFKQPKFVNLASKKA